MLRVPAPPRGRLPAALGRACASRARPNDRVGSGRSPFESGSQGVSRQNFEHACGWAERGELCHRFLEFFPKAEVHPLADAGHYVVEDAYEQIVPLVEEFLQSHPY